MADDHLLQRHRDIDRLAEEGLVYIWVAGIIITGLFAWALLRNLALGPALTHIEHEYLQPFVLAIYYACWVAGTKFDLNTQKWVYLIDPARKRFPVNSIAVVALLVGLALLLFWFKDDERWFSLSLMGLLIANVIAWLHVLSRVLPIIKQSSKHFRETSDFFALERLHVVAYYINGRWQWWRFFGMFVVAIAFVGTAFIDPLRAKVTSYLGATIPTLSAKLIPDLFLVVFVVFAEGWIWIERAKTRLAMKIIDNLNDFYQLTPVPGQMKPLESHWRIHDNLSWRAIRRGLGPAIKRRRKVPIEPPTKMP
jgi:hypothetical protein